MNSTMPKNGVDTHFHVFNAGVAVQGARYVPQYSALLSDWMQQSQSVGIQRGVWVQPSFLGADNSLMLKALQAHPDRLRGIAVVNPNAHYDELQALHDAGVRGIRLNLASVSHDIPEWTDAHSVWEAVRRLGWHLEIHTDQGRLPDVLAQLPSDLPLVVDHMAKPAQARADDPSLVALIARARHATVYVKLSGAYRLGNVNASQLASLWLHELGPDALLWGSDWPCTNHEQCADFEPLMAQARGWIEAEHWVQIMAINPHRLYWADGD
ncbi:MAG: amidohydrolase family protein [Pseudomonadota bacterium]